YPSLHKPARLRPKALNGFSLITRARLLEYGACFDLKHIVRTRKVWRHGLVGLTRAADCLEEIFQAVRADDPDQLQILGVGFIAKEMFHSRRKRDHGAGHHGMLFIPHDDRTPAAPGEDDFFMRIVAVLTDIGTRRHHLYAHGERAVPGFGSEFGGDVSVGRHGLPE